MDLVASAVEGRKLKASTPFHTEILEHVAELQRQDPAVRAALVEVGGLEELLGIIEAGAAIEPTPVSSSQLVAVEVGTFSLMMSHPGMSLEFEPYVLGTEKRNLHPSWKIQVRPSPLKLPFFTILGSCIQVASVPQTDVSP